MEKVSAEKELGAFLSKHERVAVLFHTSWCPFSRSFAPVFSAEKMPEWKKLEVLLDYYDNPLWEAYSIEVVPTAIFFEKGKAVLRLDGKPGVGLSKQGLLDALEKAGQQAGGKGFKK